MLPGQHIISQTEAQQYFQGDQKPLKVLFFFIEDCPACQYMVHHVVQLQEAHAPESLQVLGVYLPGTEGPRKFEQFVEDFRVNFPIVKDETRSWAKQFKASVTPEVILLGPDNSLLYQGALNNYYYQLGKHRKIVTRHYLLDAIAAFQAGEAIDPAYVEPIGCFIW